MESPLVARKAIGIEPGQVRHKILIVDDNPDSRKLLCYIHEPFGFDLRVAENGREAVETWREWKPGLIWMDMRMPVMDGYEAVKKIRNFELQITKKEKGKVVNPEIYNSQYTIRNCKIIAQTAFS